MHNAVLQGTHSSHFFFFCMDGSNLHVTNHAEMGELLEGAWDYLIKKKKSEKGFLKGKGSNTT